MVDTGVSVVLLWEETGVPGESGTVWFYVHKPLHVLMPRLHWREDRALVTEPDGELKTNVGVRQGRVRERGLSFSVCVFSQHCPQIRSIISQQHCFNFLCFSLFWCLLNAWRRRVHFKRRNVLAAKELSCPGKYHTTKCLPLFQKSIKV